MNIIIFYKFLMSARCVPDYKEIKRCMETKPEYIEYMHLNTFENIVPQPRDKYLKPEQKKQFSSYDRKLNYIDTDTTLKVFYQCSKDVLERTCNLN